MATRVYIRRDISQSKTSEQSTTLPVGTFKDGSDASFDYRLTLAKGTSSTGSFTGPTLAQTTRQDIYCNKFVSDALAVSSISANTWTIGITSSEGNSAANMFLSASMYVRTSSNTVRGYVYDSGGQLGSEFGTIDSTVVYSLSGSAVSSIVSTDVLVLELWVTGTQSMATAYSWNLAINETTADLTAGGGGQAAWLETPQDSLFGATAVLAPSMAMMI